ncbi:MAG TPA: D-hexose-6-phosphate mutarotase [Marinilabiliaceae bacterium]|nr:D-hexose-6-phosphate mutarotase [Marinilabiliaceae bacterium]
MELETINQRFGIQDKVLFQEENDLQMAVIVNDFATAIISLYGGQVLSFKPHDSEDLLFVSSQSAFEPDKAIRGGVPICFPWFGAHPDNRDLPNHGFARLKNWDVRSTEQLITGETRLVLSLSDDKSTMALWPHSFQTLLEIVIGKSLLIKWTVKNLGDEPFSITQALHSYFKVGDVCKTTITGLEGVSYMEAIRSEEPFSGEAQPIIIEREVDRSYTDTITACTIEDDTFKRKIKITKSGSHSTIVWNPWEQLSAKMNDLGNKDYLSFVCVETANVLHNEVKVDPQDSHSMALEIVEEDYTPSVGTIA